MPVYDTFAKRKQAAENAGKPVIYTQNHLPEVFRTQVIWILNDVMGCAHIPKGSARRSAPFYLHWESAHNTLTREMGTRTLVLKGYDHVEDCQAFISGKPNVDDVLSLIELLFREVETVKSPFKLSADDAIKELNHRFLEHGIGYQYQSGMIISCENQYLHEEAVEPAIALLHGENFSGPLQEFMDAHAHYRRGENKEAIAGAGNALESTMKAICKSREWLYDENRATASTLLDVLFSNALIPREMQSHFTALRSTLESGVPTVRNPAGHGAHGQGIVPVVVPDYLAAYCLNLTASNIVLMMEAHNALG